MSEMVRQCSAGICLKLIYIFVRLEIFNEYSRRNEGQRNEFGDNDDAYVQRAIILQDTVEGRTRHIRDCL